MGRRGTRARAADVYLEMIFRDSLYHADPQPGNLLLPDGSHIAILDFGDVGRISSMRKRQLEDLVIAAGTHDLDGFIDVVVEITTPPPTVDMNRLRSQIDAWLNRYLLIGVGHLDMAAIINTGMQLLHDNGLVLPADLSLLFRVMLQLQGLGRNLNTEVRVTELLEPYMKKLLAERFDPRRVAPPCGTNFRGWDHLASFPARRHRGDRPADPHRQTRRRLPGPRFRRRRGSSRRRPRRRRFRARVRAIDLASHWPDSRIDLGAGGGRRRRRCAHLATTRPTPTRAQDVGQPRPRTGRATPPGCRVLTAVVISWLWVDPSRRSCGDRGPCAQRVHVTFVHDWACSVDALAECRVHGPGSHFRDERGDKQSRCRDTRLASPTGLGGRAARPRAFERRSSARRGKLLALTAGSNRTRLNLRHLDATFVGPLFGEWHSVRSAGSRGGSTRSPATLRPRREIAARERKYAPRYLACRANSGVVHAATPRFALYAVLVNVSLRISRGPPILEGASWLPRARR